MARHSPGCDTAGAVVHAGAKQGSVNLKAVPTGSRGSALAQAPQQCCLGKGTARSRATAELSPSPGSSNSRKGEALKAVTL